METTLSPAEQEAALKAADLIEQAVKVLYDSMDEEAQFEHNFSQPEPMIESLNDNAERLRTVVAEARGEFIEAS